jgi:hypothetical protein
VIATVGEEQRARVIRDLELAERTGAILRQPGGVKLTDRGWSLVAADGE